jgi:hypothetical protein
VNQATAALAAALLALAACGDGGSDAPAKDDYVAAANDVCADAREELLSISGQLTADTPLAQIEAFLHDVYVPRLRTELDEVRDLGYPDGDRDDLEAIFDDYGAILDDIEANADDFARSGIDPFADVDARLDAYGLGDCGSGASS